MQKFSKKIFLSPPFLNGNEINHLTTALDSNWIAPAGPQVKNFEEKLSKYLNRPHAAALSSGTAALHLALKILNVSKGDLVFCSDLTFVASANVIKYVGADPIFIDSDLSSWNMCAKSLDKAFKQHLPKAVIVTDLYGQSANYKEITDICNKYRVPIIEDSAESLGAEYYNRKCGSFGEISVISFNGNKIITTSGGGMILSNNKDYIEKAKKLSTQAREKKIYYEHLEIGYNYRMSNILAALGLAQLNYLDYYVDKTRRIFQIYKKNLKSINGIEFMPEIKGGKSTNWLSAILLKKTSYKEINNLITYLNEKNVESIPIWKPMHMQPLYSNYDFFSVEKNPVSEFLFEHGICLPSGCNLNKEDQIKISIGIKNYLNNEVL